MYFDIVLADFGLACFLNEDNLIFKRCGTPGFVAPEILAYKVKFSYKNIYIRKAQISYMILNVIYSLLALFSIFCVQENIRL